MNSVFYEARCFFRYVLQSIEEHNIRSLALLRAPNLAPWCWHHLHFSRSKCNSTSPIPLSFTFAQPPQVAALIWTYCHVFIVDVEKGILEWYSIDSFQVARKRMATRTIISLDDRRIWTFRQAHSPASQWMEVRDMPTNIHLDLLYNGIISNPFIGKRENDCQWVGEKTWIYRATFPAPIVGSGIKAVLVFHGLDTYATITLNGQEILKTKDMFIPERVVVTNILHSEHENTLEITFESTYLIGKKFVEQHPNHLWGCWNGDPSRLAVRKAQYHYVK